MNISTTYHHRFSTTYHHSFAGGSKNTSRLLHYLSGNGCSVDAYFFEKPQFFEYTNTKVKIHTLNSNRIQSEVIDSSVITNYSISNQIVEKFDETKKNVLFGINLFPYCDILVDAKSQLKNVGNLEAKLIIHPVGSDIWQIGPQIKTRVKWLLDNPLVDCILTYSDCFIDDIKEYYKIRRGIHVLPPVLENEKFFPLSNDQILQRRNEIGLKENDFIISHHSSMRRIKCPEVVLDIAQKSAQLISSRCILIMMGPIPFDVIQSLNLNLIKCGNDESLFEYKSKKGSMIIYWTGVLSNVEYLLQISNVEINASLYDSFNLSLMEAMACGVPVVSSDIVGISKHISASKAGFCFRTNKLGFDELNKTLQSNSSKKSLFDIDFAVSAIAGIAKESICSKARGLNGARYVSETFSYENAAKQFYKHIN